MNDVIVKIPSRNDIPAQLWLLDLDLYGHEISIKSSPYNDYTFKLFDDHTLFYFDKSFKHLAVQLKIKFG